MDPLRIIHGNCLEVLAGMPEGSVDCCVTSPPFLWLRDYGLAPVPWPEVTYVPMTGVPPVTVPAGMAVLGLEPDPLAYIGHLVAVFREVRRVLSREGTAWVEMGDGYANGGGTGGQGNKGQRATRRHTQVALHRVAAREHDLKPKDLIGSPWRLALALQADGWYLRQEIVWHKRNPMPESCKDRPTRTHSTVFMLAKAPRYWFDAEAIAEPISALTHARMAQDIEAQAGSIRANGGERADRPMKCVGPAFPGVNPKALHQATPRGWQQGPGAHDTLPKGNYRETQAPSSRQNPSFSAAISPRIVDRRNSRSVWTIAIQGYSGNHYATFTAEVPRRCILAGCRPGGTVLDPFGGAGTTGAVALELGRRAVLIEMAVANCELARKRCSGVQMCLGIGGSEMRQQREGGRG